MAMKKVLFYIQNGWVFGKIHNELIKVLYPEFYCDILCWTTEMSNDAMTRLSNKYDLIVSTPEGCLVLHGKGIPFEKMVGVVHQDWDVFDAIRKGMISDQFSKLAGYAVICPLLQHISLSHGVARVPDVLPIGVFQDNYPRNTSSRPSNVGHFSKSERFDQGYDVKRGVLVVEVANKMGLKVSQSESTHFLGVERLYSSVDLVISPSLVEGNPYPMLEAFACGIPCLSTPTGVAGEYLRNGGGALLPLKAEDLVYKATYEIGKMQQDSGYYRQLADESYEIGRSIDWSRIRETWINYFSTL